jgi:hypothetical protein
MGLKHALILGLIFLNACAQGHCRRKADEPQMQPAPAAAADPIAKPSANDRIFVYKYDGSLQCGLGKAVAVEAMAKELQGVTVYSSSKKSDGLMHIQVCGSITGMANVYEIPASQQKKAEGRGFKKWSFE